MRSLILLAIVISMSTLTLPQNLPAPQAITDPKQITSKPNANVEQNQQSLSIERLYMTRSVGSHHLVAGRQDHRLHLQHQRPQQYLAGARRRRMAHATHGQRPAPDSAHMVARRQVDRLHLRLRRRRAVGHFLRLAEDRTGHQHHQHARDLGRESDLVAQRPLSRLHGEAEDVVGVRNRHLRHADARHQTPDHRHAQGQDERRIPSGPPTTSGSPTPSSRPREQIPTSSSPKSQPARAHC